MISFLIHNQDVRIGDRSLNRILAVPEGPNGLVIFAHGSGSSRLSPRNTHVADQFNALGIGTLLFDLLTDVEASDRANVFDIPLLGASLKEAIEWVRGDPQLNSLPIAIFGASTGAAAALVAAAEMPNEVAVVVSRGGRPDLAGEFLSRVRAPTLLIVGGADTEVIELNKQAFERLSCEKRLAIVPGATHLFEEPGTLDTVVELAGQWFKSHLQQAH